MKAFTKRTEASPNHRYLKPGALAQLRDSRISARSHRLSDSLRQFAAAGLTRDLVQPQVPITAMDRLPQFISSSFGPRHLKRKRLVAARSVNLPSLEPASSESMMNMLGGDAVAAR